ncbi:MAG: DUF3298 domain-containing protein [Chloroflexi bacterium]|nr:DUF3298 domain-containing protein [Chloroflexota bacterium]
MDEQMSTWKDQYNNTPIPAGFDLAVRKALASRPSIARPVPLGRWVAVSAASLLLLFVVAVNALPALALALQDVPVLGPLVEVLTLARFRAASDEQLYRVDVAVPEVQGLSDAALQTSLNERYLAEGQTLYEQFMSEMGALEQGEVAHKALDAGYRVRVNTDTFLVVERWVVEVMASGAESVTFDNIDLVNQVVVTLPSLFVDDGYVQTITANIKEQMRSQMADPDTGAMYFIDEFSQIKPDQSFYINAEHKLVIVFNEYEVAPGAMGVVEFIIPTEVLADALVGHGYIQ